MNSKEILNLVLKAMFTALVLVLGLTPVGIIPLGAINVTILHIPVIVGTLFLGLGTGLWLGALFGVCSLMSAFGLTLTPPSGLASALGAANPILLAAMCILPRLLVPLFSWLVQKLLIRAKAKNALALAVAGGIGSATNTVFYLSLMTHFYAVAQLDVNALLSKLGIQGLSFWGVIGTIAGGAGGLEALAAVVLTPPIVAALQKAQGKQQGGRKLS